MKKLVTFLLFFAASAVYAQRDDRIVYYEDSYVRDSRFGLALVLNPNYTDRRLIDDDVIPEGGGFDLTDNRAKGAFAFNYSLDVIYSIGSALDLSVGFGLAEANYNVDNALLYNTENFDFGISDSLLVDATTNVDMYTVPVKLNFNTTISDIFDLEVVPTVQLIFINKYESTFSTQGGDDFTYDFTDQTQDLNYTVGISLGGTWYFAENWGFFLHGNARYMLNSMIELENYPRETIYSFGANTGLRLRF